MSRSNEMPVYDVVGVVLGQAMLLCSAAPMSVAASVMQCDMNEYEICAEREKSYAGDHGPNK